MYLGIILCLFICEIGLYLSFRLGHIYVCVAECEKPCESVFPVCILITCYLCCRLEELFLCLNEYKRVNLSRVPCPSLRLLHITDNLLQDWNEVRKLGLLYPRLTSLILANNSLSSIHEPDDSLQCLFPNLHRINLHNSSELSSFTAYCHNALKMLFFRQKYVIL